MYSGAMHFKHLASSYYLKALHTASAVRMCASKEKKNSSLVRVWLGCGACGMCTLCLDLFCKGVKNISMYLHRYYLCVGYFSITHCSVRLMTLSPAINELGFAVAEIVVSYTFWMLFCTLTFGLDPENIICIEKYIFVSFSFIFFHCSMLYQMLIDEGAKNKYFSKSLRIINC